MDFGEAEIWLRALDWSAMERTAPAGGEGTRPFLLFFDPEDSFFMLSAADGGFHISAQVKDKWNLLGILAGEKTFTLDLGILPLDDALTLLKLFYEDNYPALRGVEKLFRGDHPGP